MDVQTLADVMVSVGERYATSVKDLRKLALKLVVLSLKYVDRKALWAQLFGPSLGAETSQTTDAPEAEYVDWALVERAPPAGNILGDASVWLGLTRVCSWEGIQPLEAEISLNHAPLHGLRQALRAAGLDPGGAEGWTMVCAAYILTLIQGVPALHALDLLTCQFFKRSTRSACMAVLSQLSDTPYTQHQHQATLCFVLQHAVVNTGSLERALSVIRASREERRLNLQLKSMTVIQGRPRLRDRAAVTEEYKSDTDMKLKTWESYRAWSYKHSLPSTLSEGIRMRLYFLAAQTAWPWRDHLKTVIQSAPIAVKVAAYPVTQPDVPVLIQVIETLSMDGQAPFQELTDFRTGCFQSFPMSHTQRMTLTQVLQLYVAAYQPPGVWKDIWKHLCGVISVQVPTLCLLIPC